MSLKLEGLKGLFLKQLKHILLGKTKQRLRGKAKDTFLWSFSLYQHFTGTLISDGNRIHDPQGILFPSSFLV